MVSSTKSCIYKEEKEINKVKSKMRTLQPTNVCFKFCNKDSNFYH